MARRLEAVDLRNPRGVAKVVGTLVSLAGVMTMTLYKGSVVRNLAHPLIRIDRRSSSASDLHGSWLKGSILTVASCITWSIWYVMQVFSLKPPSTDPLSLVSPTNPAHRVYLSNYETINGNYFYA